MNDDDQHREFLLAALRAARLRAQLMEAELTTIGVSLKAKMISPAVAMQWIHDEGLMPLISMQTEEQTNARIEG